MNILLTGASRGIGKGISVDLMKRGHTIISLGRNPTSEHNIHCDFNEQQDYSNLLMEAMNRLPNGPGFDVLINNAGICYDLDLQESAQEQWMNTWRKTFDVNLFSPVGLTRSFVNSALVDARQAKVINICSRVAFKGQASSPQYAASKAALLNFTRSMAVCYASKKVSFFSISPCWVATDMANEPMEKMISDIPAKTIAQVEDITPAVKFLVEDATMFMTGMNMDINGASYFH